MFPWRSKEVLASCRWTTFGSPQSLSIYRHFWKYLRISVSSYLPHKTSPRKARRNEAFGQSHWKFSVSGMPCSRPKTRTKARCAPEAPEQYLTPGLYKEVKAWEMLTHISYLYILYMLLFFGLVHVWWMCWWGHDDKQQQNSITSTRKSKKPPLPADAGDFETMGLF